MLGSPGDEAGKRVYLSSADEAVDGLRGLLLFCLGGGGSLGAGDSVMCGAAALKEKATSVKDGTDTEGKVSWDCGGGGSV